MKIAFLGKGGSGKSTLATQCVKYLQSRGDFVLAIDADHNMDLSLNLGVPSPSVFLGTDPSLIKSYIGLPSDAEFGQAREAAIHSGVYFHLGPTDDFTKKLTTALDDKTLLMTAGPHTDSVRSGENCSHSLAAPLKVYLPLLKLKAGQSVVIDERAGTDPVATGILKGVDLAVIVAEPTVFSVRVARQIAHELKIAEVPFVIVANKVQGESLLLNDLPTKPIASVMFSPNPNLDDVMKVLVA